MRLKRFGQLLESKFEDHFPITNEDIEDLCLEMTDIGFEVNIERSFINQGVSKSITKEPLSSRSTPIYDIRLKSINAGVIQDDERWNGGLYFEDIATLSNFVSVSKKFVSFYKNYKVLYNIRGSDYTIRIILREVESEIGFDWGVFSNNLCDHLGDILPDTFDVVDVISGLEAVLPGRPRIKMFEITQQMSQEEAIGILNKSKSDQMDNRSDFDLVTDQIDNLTKDYVKSGHISIGYRFVEMFTWRPPKETIFDKTSKKFKFFGLEVTINNLSE